LCSGLPILLARLKQDDGHGTEHNSAEHQQTAEHGIIGFSHELTTHVESLSTQKNPRGGVWTQPAN
jgi:hypothetical protein